MLVHFLKKSLVLFTLMFCCLSSFAQEVRHSERTSRGKVTAPVLAELSGIIASINNPGMFWVHNDSGDDANVYLIDSAARLMKTYRLEGIEAIDIEDIAWVELDGRSHIVLGDIGDNRAKRNHISLYVFPEPHFVQGNGMDTIKRNDIKIKEMNYPGNGRDAEAFFIDPLDKQLYLISKREFNSVLYTANIFNQSGRTILLKPLIKFPFTFITAADISHNRDAIVMKSLTNIYYWPLSYNEPIVEALKKDFLPVMYEPEPQGEAITFDRFSDGFFTISEKPFGLDSYLYYYHISKP